MYQAAENLSNQGSRRERKDAQRNHARVLEAAQALFAERGPAVTMEEIARRAGVGVGTVYRCYPSKERLFSAISQAACTDVERSLEQAIAAEDEPLQKLRALVVLHYQRCPDYAALLHMQPESPEAKDNGPSHHSFLYETLQGMLVQIITEGQQHGRFGQGDIVAQAALCVELLHPRTVHRLQQLLAGCTEHVAEQVFVFMLHGLQARQS